MFANERYEAICNMLKKDGAVTTSKLVKLFDVSIETVRKDLMYLEKQGHLSRVHGGAIQKVDMKPFSSLKYRNDEFSTEKKELAEKAVEFVSDGDVVGIDAGSTSMAFAQALKGKFSRLTVVTYCIDVFNELKDCNGYKLILCGGEFLPEENVFVGPFTINMIEKIYVNKLFLAPATVSLDYGLCENHGDFYQIQQQFIKSSDTVFVLADSSKFEKKALFKLGEMSTSYEYITDSLLSEELIQVYEENGITIHRRKGKNNEKTQ